MDTLTREKRSWNMSQIRGRDTKPEMMVRSLLHFKGYRFRLHRKNLTGNPDIVLPRYKTIILVHGCFWHRHEGCKFAYSPKTRVEFWQEKFKKNVRRDIEVYNALTELGWHVYIIWGCETRKTEQLGEKIDAIFA